MPIVLQCFDALVANRESFGCADFGAFGAFIRLAGCQCEIDCESYNKLFSRQKLLKNKKIGREPPHSGGNV